MGSSVRVVHNLKLAEVIVVMIASHKKLSMILFRTF